MILLRHVRYEGGPKKGTDETIAHDLLSFSSGFGYYAVTFTDYGTPKRTADGKTIFKYHPDPLARQVTRV